MSLNGTDPLDGDRSYEWCLREAALADPASVPAEYAYLLDDETARPVMTLDELDERMKSWST